MESTGKYWNPVFNILEKACWVTLAHPKYTKPQKGNKTDRKDAKWICDLYMCGMVKPSFIPPPDIRQLRDLMRYRMKLTNMLTGEKNRAQNCLTVSNLKLDDVFSDVFGKSSRSIIQYILEHPGEQFDVVPDKYKEAKAEIVAIYHENKGRYGYRRITTELHNRGFSMNHKTVQRLMKELGLVCRVRIKKYRSYKGEVGKIAPNLLNRNFYAEKPNQKWVTDVTEFSLFGQKMYLSPILDLHNGYLVSYTISDRPVLGMITSMLEKAFETIPDGTGLILHSDQGWQYQHKQYQCMLRRKGIRQSMSRKGNCLDNAVMENFFGLLKSELLYLQKFDSLEHLKQELVDYLDYYNNRRIRMKRKGLPPALHRQQALSVA